MRLFALLMLFCAAIFCLDSLGFCGNDSNGWEFVKGIKESDISEVAVDVNAEGVIYAASLKRLYKTKDAGETWKAVFIARGSSNVINFITLSGKGVYVCTENGVFESTDGESNWKKFFEGVGVEENSVSHMAISESGTVYLGTRGGLIVSNDNGETWKKDPNEAGNIGIRWVALKDDVVFLAAEDGVYRGRDSGWQRVFVTITETVEYNSDETDESVAAAEPVNSILVTGKGIFLATDTGIFVSGDNGYSWRSFVSKGLMSEKVKRLLVLEPPLTSSMSRARSDNIMFAATDEGVFVFDEESKMWSAMYRGMDADKAYAIAGDKKDYIWAATNKGVYRSLVIASPDTEGVGANQSKEEIDSLVSFPRSDNRRESENILKLFEHEPSIKKVQDAAIEYAEVHPNKINAWREAAKKKALLPKLSVGVDRHVTDYWHWDAGQNPDVLIKGDDVISWDVSATWDIGELIWNDDQTSIDTRSRLMVQLRDDILDEVTRTYFERRRLQIETHLSPPPDLKLKWERELRIQELTADLDALTGGYFSEQLE